MRSLEGQGAVSTGPMVPVMATNDEGRSRSALALLEAHGIPALLDADLNGEFLGFHEPVPDGWVQVFVPSDMRPRAAELLRAQELPAENQRRPRPSPVFEPPRPGARPQRRPHPGPPASPRGPDRSSDNLEALVRGSLRAEPGLPPGFPIEEPTEAEEVSLPEPSPLPGRLALALAAISAGAALQHGLTLWQGWGAVASALAARSPFYEEVFRLVTASFLHGGVAHAASNAAFGLVFGVVLMGTHRVGATALTWLLASAMGLAAEVSLSSGALVLGASAGNYGLVGLWARGQLERARLSLLPRRERLKTFGVILLLLPGALTPVSSSGSRVAVLAHVAGFLGGFLAGAVFHRRLLPRAFSRIDARSRVAGLLAVSLAGAGWMLGLGSLFGG